MNKLKLTRPITITMWDFSWLERRWPGAGYEDWDLALEELVVRGYNAVRIDCYPHLVAVDPHREWHLIQRWTENDWGSPAPITVCVQPTLNEFLAACRRHDVKVGLSTWFREDDTDARRHIASAAVHGAIFVKTLRSIEKAGLLDQILYVDLCNEWPGWGTAFFNQEPGWDASDWRSPRSMAWMREAIGTVRVAFPDLAYCFSFSEHLSDWQGYDLSFMDLLELHLWVAHDACDGSDFYKRVGYKWEVSSTSGYEPVVKNAEKLYRSDPVYWRNKLGKGIHTLAEWSIDANLPIITTECWGIVDYKDWPGLNWDWVMDLCAFGTETAVSTGRWAGIATSNFCGPQFRGMWREVEWHRRLTDLIKQGKLPAP